MIEVDQIICADGRNLRQISRESGLGESTISNWINGHRVPSGLINLVALLNTLGYDLTIVKA